MTLATTNTDTPTINTIVKDALVRAGLLHPQQSVGDHQHKDLAAFARRQLADLITELMASNVILRWVQFNTLTLTASTADYQLALGIEDVLGSLMYKPAATSAETTIRQMRDEEWQRLTSKEADGVPSRCLVYKADEQLTLRFWPVPDLTGATVRYRAHVRPFDMDDGSLCLDMPPYWTNWVKDSLGACLAGSQGLAQREQTLYAKARAQYDRNMNKSQSRAAIQATIGHGGHSRRRG